jgi:hypothetical protein
MRRPVLAAALLIALSACQAAPSWPPVAASVPVSVPAPKANFEPVSGHWQVVKAANLRAGPNTDFPVIGGVRAGETLDVLGKVPGAEWLAVKMGDRHAYIHTRLVQQLDELPAVTQKTIVAVPAPVKQAAVMQAPPRAVQAAPLVAPVAAPTPLTPAAPAPVPAPVEAPTTVPVSTPARSAVPTVPAVPAVPRAAGDWVATGDPIPLRPIAR